MAAKVYRKEHKGRNWGMRSSGVDLAFGSFGLRALDYCRLTEKQLMSLRTAAMRPIKGACTMWNRIFPSIIVTKKPQEVRMGGGKGAPEYKIFRVTPGRILLEVTGVDVERAREAFALAAAKLPIKTQFVYRQGGLVLGV